MAIESTLIQNQARTYAENLYYLTGQIFRTGKPADRVIGSHFRRHKKFGSRDRRFMAETFFSIFRWWGWLRHTPGLSDRFWDHEPKDAIRLKAWLRILLGAHMLDCVEMAPVAVYWKECLGEECFLTPVGDAPVGQKAEHLSDFLDHRGLTWRELVPEWLFESLPLEGEAQRALIERLQMRPPMWLRTQTKNQAGLIAALRAAKLTVEPSIHLPQALRVENTYVNLYELESFRDGEFEVQDFASQVIGRSCAPKPGERWWDCCAGAGGKTLQLADMMQSKGTILASDIRDYKLEDLRKRARRPGFSNIRTKAWDGKSLPTRKAKFDGVLVDAPCSNSGTWRRNPDARWTLTREDVEEMSAMQLGILETVAPAVVEGGVLVYGTCSICREENEAIVEAFLAKHPEFQPDTVQHPITKMKHKGMLRIWPDEGDCDGMFVARMLRKG